MKVKIVGVENQKGEYEGRAYHNLILHVLAQNSNSNKDIIGNVADTVKIKYVNLDDIFQMGMSPEDVEKMPASDFSHLLSQMAEVYYNKFGGVDSVILIPPEKNASTPSDNKTK